MSGGVDSAVAAYLLQQAGHEVSGVTLRTWVSEDGTESRCCEIDDARKTAWKLHIPYYALNCISAFQETVIDPFVRDYLSGITPNPCVFCNREIKWEKLLYAAKVMKADYVATGHYASVVRKPNGRYTVKKARHAEKDQTYMLYRLTQEQLAATMMPLGEFTKDEVRKIAARAGLPSAAKPDSQELCFVPDGNYAEYIEKQAGEKVPGEGFFVDGEGNILGKHRGIIHYTVGQRKGLGLPLGYPAYIREIRADRNEIVVGDEASLYSKELCCGSLNFLSIPTPKAGEKIPCAVKVRYHHGAQAACLEMLDADRAKITFGGPVRAAAPGQSAVFYDEEDCVIGGGIILPKR